MLTNEQSYWEELAQIDPYWAILSDPKYRYGKWDLNDFFRSGEQQVHHTMNLASIHGLPAERDLALDFGCGVGRLTRSLAPYFQEVHAFDFSKSMIERARELNGAYTNCHFDLIQNGPQDLPSSQYDLIYSLLVLQHLPSNASIKEYIREFIRLIKPDGLIIFQLPHEIPAFYRLHLQRHIYRILRTLGFTGRFLHYRLGLMPVGNLAMPQTEVAQWLKDCGGILLDVVSSGTNVVRDSFYYVTKK
jgi:SAM-dependent methyltransferase